MSSTQVESIFSSLKLAQTNPHNRTRQGWLRSDEFDIDFKDDRWYAIKSWEEISNATRQNLSDADYATAREVYNFETLDSYVMRQIASPPNAEFSRQMSKITHLPRTLGIFVGGFEMNVFPLKVDMKMLWSMVYYTIKLSTESPAKLKRTIESLVRLRRTLALCNECMDLCERKNELRIELPTILDALMLLLDSSVHCLLNSPTDKEFASNSPNNELKATECLKSLDDTLVHLYEINSYSKVNQERQVRFLSMRTAAHPDLEETATFPVQMLPQDRNELFFGREAELAAINAKLGTDQISSLQTYTIYGRRGVGKTQVALEYVYRNLGNFDAIFWIQCETSASLRQSITDAANELNLPGASQSGHFEENLVSTHNWLKRTSKRWLLVFDNAEDERLLKGYWPIGARGSILITSRKYYNFIKDIDRGGKTIPPFDNAHSLELLLKFLGTGWQDAHLIEPFRESDLAAARSLVKMIGGLALAIEQAASLILSLRTHLRGFLDIFVNTLERLPDRPLGKRDPLIQSLDTIFSIAFKDLSMNARTLLGVLAFLAPDGIQLDLFLPHNQKILQGRLDFCMTSPTGQEDSHAALSNVIDPPPDLQKVIDELLEAKLIRFDNRTFSVHRAIQEALNFRDFAELQDSFDAAVCLLFEAFPKQESGDPLHTMWSTCQDYVQHVVQLFKKFKELRNPEATISLAARKELILLGANCGWYLLEIADYNECLNMVKTAQSVCNNQETLTVAQLHNTAGAAYIELNQLDLCREGWEIAKSIREDKLDPDHRLVASILANLANLETAEENFQEARALLLQAAAIREKIGDSAATMLALTYLQIGRVDTLEKKFPEALKMFQKSEALFNRQRGSANYLADLHYWYGNRAYLQSKYDEARRSYATCLKIAMANRPLHPLTGAAYYKLGSCEYELNNYDKARKLLYKALNIAEIQNPGSDDGTVARILWKLAQVLKDIHVNPEEAQEMETRAVLIRGGITGQHVAEDNYLDEKEYEIMEHSYDALVSVFFR